MPQDTLYAVDEALRALFRGRRGARLHAEACRRVDVRLDPPAFFLLSLLAERPARLTDLACRVGLDASTISRKLQELEAAGLTTRQDDPADRRAALLTLSEQGLETLSRVGDARRAHLGELLADWSEADRLELARLLGRFAETVARSAAEGRR
jgi:DNA-binding MarR family transcriptional regulator